jgi:hypothetical protein
MVKEVQISPSRIPVIAIALLVGLASVSLAEDHHPSLCSNATLKGPYGYYRTGSNFFDDGTEGPVVAVGVWTYDGNGHTSGIESGNYNGDFVPDAEHSGGYQVNSDCRGMLFNEIGEEFARIVVMNGGDIVYLLGENNPWYVVQTRIKDK